MTSNNMFRIFLPFALFTCGVQCLAYCGYKTLYTSNSGKIALSNYGRDTDCTYQIKLSDSTRWIKLIWSSFKVDGDMPVCKDYVKVSTGCGYSSRLVAKFCSNNLNSFDRPHDVYSPDGCMSIQIKAVGSTKKSGLGFLAQYTSSPSYTSESRSNCRSTNYEYSSTGVILSPNWPNGYSGYFPYYNKCEWKINRNSNEKIQLNFMDMNVISSSFSCYSALPYVKYEGEQSRSTSYFPENRYCSSQIPFSKNTDYYELEVEMKQSTLSYSNKGRGFVVGWIAYTVDTTTTTTATTVINTNTRSSSSNITIIGSVITVIIVVAIVSIVVGLRHRAARTRRGRNIFVQPNTNQMVINNSTTQPLTYQNAAPYQQQGYTNDSKSLGAPPPYPGPADPNMPYQNLPPFQPEQQGAAAAYPQQMAPYLQQQPPATAYPPEQPAIQHPLPMQT